MPANRYLPNTAEDQREMLKTAGFASMVALFDAAIPKKYQFSGTLKLPPALSEDALISHLSALANKNLQGPMFAGAGAYDHFSPAAIDALIQRGEFLTAYTPYQPEVSQGTLTAIFEFQTMIAALTGMEVANASLYDGASALAEACLMAQRARKGRNEFVMAGAIHPEYLEVVETYLGPSDAKIVRVAHDASGRVDVDALGKVVGDKTAAVCIGSPNVFGVVEDVEAICRMAKAAGAMSVASFTEAISLGLLNPAGHYGADIVCGEGQSLGIPMSIGGPYLGLFATQMAHVRTMPGRLAGQTVDASGKRGFVLTLSTREQHIRREKATSNICTNQALMALVATIYMSLMGKEGLTKVARLNFNKAEYTKSVLAPIKGVRLPFSAPTFNEFVIETPLSSATLLGALRERGIIGGVALARWHPNMPNAAAIAVTERREKGQIDELASAVRSILQ